MSLGGYQAHVEVDTIGARSGPLLPQLEIKGWPVVDGRGEPSKVGAAGFQQALVAVEVRGGLARRPERVAVHFLLRHAFEDLGAVRVQFKTDLNNLHSQRAIEKLGATREGVLRRYQIRSNGTVRDTAMYSILAEEWPQVKARLEARLAAAG